MSQTRGPPANERKKGEDNMKCFYHSADLDGHCSGAIVKLFAYPSCELRPIDYGDAFPWDDIIPGETVFMVDFALQPFSDMERLAGLVDLYWLDHHKSAIEEANKSRVEFLGVREIGRAGCELTWDYLTGGKDVPDAVRHLGRYDVWDHSDEDTLPFQYGMRMLETRPEKNLGAWELLLSYPRHNLFYEILGRGRIALEFVKADNDKYCGACSFETELDGLKCLVVNKMLTNSQLFDGYYDPEKHDAMLSFGYRGGRWVVSLYTTKDEVDVSVVAKARGGGGHKSAAGFQCSSLPFKM